ncbi:DNA topoisomerase III [Dendrobium catenatum]|uniref:DNA topoisomerase III n=1 Tax=Dendrobium catenatum TaxID=906689 RepID=A0A2I0X9A8_9ASPA|nr:DNA topoisomerase III [Dendrobium catenatum]
MAIKFQKHLSSNPCFKVGKDGAFKILHYAGEVVYDTSGFLKKSGDPFYSDLVQLLQSYSCQLLRTFTSHMLNQSQRSTSPQRLNGADSQKQSVGTKFKAQLFRLMQRLENTTPHFIRCIKPNRKFHFCVALIIIRKMVVEKGLDLLIVCSFGVENTSQALERPVLHCKLALHKQAMRKANALHCFTPKGTNHGTKRLQANFRSRCVLENHFEAHLDNSMHGTAEHGQYMPRLCR